MSLQAGGRVWRAVTQMTRSERGARQRGRVGGRVQAQDEVGDDCGRRKRLKRGPCISWHVLQRAKPPHDIDFIVLTHYLCACAYRFTIETLRTVVFILIVLIVRFTSQDIHQRLRLLPHSPQLFTRRTPRIIPPMFKTLRLDEVIGR